MLLEDLQKKIYYHVSYTRFEKSILRKGLMPNVGHQSVKMNEENGIFLFKSLVDLEDALMNWLGNELDEDEGITIFQVTIPDESKLQKSVAEYEVIYPEIIPPNYIKVLRRE